MRWQLCISLLILLLGSASGSISVSMNTFPGENFDKRPEIAHSSVKRAAQSQLSLTRKIVSASADIDCGNAKKSALSLSAIFAKDKARSAEETALLANNLGLSYFLSSRRISEAGKRIACLELAHEFLQISRGQSQKDEMLSYVAIKNDEKVLQELSRLNKEWLFQAEGLSREARQLKKRLATHFSSGIFL